MIFFNIHTEQKNNKVLTTEIKATIKDLVNMTKTISKKNLKSLFDPETDSVFQKIKANVISNKYLKKNRF